MLPATGRLLHVRSSRVVLDGEPGAAVVTVDRETGRVLGIGEAPAGADVVDVGGSLVVPAPLDLHFHGAFGHVVPPAGRVADIDAALAGSAAGRGSDLLPPPAYEWVATLPVPGVDRGSDVLDSIVRELAAAARAITHQRESGGTRCVGLRLEGAFLNPVRAGVWPPEHFLAPFVANLEPLVRAASDEGTPLLIVDLAPEAGYQGESLELIARARELGVVCSLAHTDATWEQARSAIDAGATLATHAWNAMRPVSHRDPGVVAAALADPRVTCELICDGVHLHPGAIELSIAACGPGRWAAVSDASPFAGCEPGEYEWAGTTVTHDGTALRDSQGRLAGSASLLWRAGDVLRLAGADQLQSALAMGASPRRVLDPSRPLGLAVGDPAWVVPAR